MFSTPASIHTKNPTQQAAVKTDIIELSSLTLKTSTGKLISFATAFEDHYGVLFFFPGFKVGKEIPLPIFWGCTPESCAYNSHLAEFSTRHTKIFGVTKQNPELVNLAIEEQNLIVPILIDDSLALAHALGICTWKNAENIYVNRDTIIIGPGGKILEHIRAIDLSVEATRSSEQKAEAHVADVLNRLDNLLQKRRSCTMS